MNAAKVDWLPPVKSDGATREEHWKKSLLRNETGGIKAALANAIAALRLAPAWQGVLGFDEFTVRTVALRATPWNPEPHEWDDREDILLAEWLQLEGVMVSKDIAGQAVEAVARERSFHPVRRYLESLAWDGTPRLPGWLQKYFGARPELEGGDRYLSAVGTRWPISAVARVTQPGCKADCVLILEALQGKGKSTGVKILAGEWFADEVADLGTKDAAMQTRGVWILELAELDAMSRAETSKIKAFVSRGTDHFRPPYGRRIIDLPRQCVFAGTVNHSAYLKDETGGRRFWPVACGTIDVEALAHDRDQLWAEARVRYEDGEPWWLDSDELTRDAEAVQATRYDSDVWDPVILEWAASRIDSGCESLAIGEVLELCLGKKPDHWTRGDEVRVGRCLSANKWERYRDRKKGMQWRYRPVVPR